MVRWERARRGGKAVVRWVVKLLGRLIGEAERGGGGGGGRTR